MANAIVAENQLEGTLDWQITRFLFEYPESTMGLPLTRGLRSPAIEGFASATSVYPGESIDFKVSMNPAGSYTIDIYRMGFYGGKGGRHYAEFDALEGKPQPLPRESVERLRECQWETAVSYVIPEDWPSGVYLAKLSRELPQPAQSYIIFVVKRRGPADIIVQVSDLTWQAYNKWPGVNSLYDDGSPYLWYQGPNVRVGFDRPYAKYPQVVDAPLSCGSGEFLLWEYPLAYWLESEGYDVAYYSNLDLHTDADLAEKCRVFISIGHDEYWTRQMYNHASGARDAGVSLLFLSGNAMYHEIKTYGGRFRSFARDRRFTDEHELMGSSTFGPGYGDWTVTKPDHWLFEGTGMKQGDRIPGLVGWEYHGTPFKEVDGLEIVAESELAVWPPFEEAEATKHEPGRHSAVIYPGPKGNWVFNAGTIWWAEGLSCPPGHIPAMGTFGRPQGVDARVQMITRNLLDKCLSTR
ncbi:N,N-dimethylformamidase beta subunit family domain-containing protein [Paenibacillus sp. GCM10027626]|uniref:N,N-dimethylformamidase beta subunit family domain-containing protein n=1 Tax=Paenibacillus sp. GCM10027626 TaxID=3273411 RepID=UPI00362788E9